MAETVHPLRQAVFEDCEAITALLAGLDLAVPEGRDAVLAHWDHLWRANPAIEAHGGAPELGWVIEDGGRIVGFFGNIPLLYYHGTRPVPTSSARAWAVEKPYRSQTRRLAEAFFGQTGVGLLLITTANQPAGRLCLRHGASKLPQHGYGRVLTWVTDASGFAAAALRKAGLAGPLAGLGGGLAGPLLGALPRFGRPRLGSPADISGIAVGDIGADFDDLWRRKIAEGERLLACRDARTLRWYFGPAAAAGRARVLACRRDGRLEGYAVVYRDDAPAIGLRRARIADLLVAGDDPAATDGLLGAAWDSARDDGCHVLEVVGLPRSLRARIETTRPLSRPMPTFPFFYKSQEPTLAAALEREETWHVTSYDGDTSLL